MGPPAPTPPEEPPEEPSPVRAAVVLAGLYALAGAVAVGAAGGGCPAIFWPPAGVALGGLVRWGRRAWPGVAVAALAVELVSVRVPWVVPGVVFGQVAAALLGAYLVRRLGGGRAAANHLPGAAALVLGGAVIGTLPSALCGPTAVWAAGVPRPDGSAVAAADLPQEMLVWWVGDAVAALLVAPALVVGWRRPAATPGGRAAALIGAASVIGLGAAVAAAPGLPNWLIGLAPCLPAAVWAAARFGPAGAAAANLLTAGVVSALVFAGGVGDDRLAVALFAAVVGLTGLCVGATAAERDAAVRAGAAGRERLRALLARSHDVVGVLGPDGRVAYLNEAAARLTGHPHDWLVGGDPFTHIHPDDAPATRAALAGAAAAPGHPQTVQVRLLKADGSWAWFEAVLTDRAADPAVGGVVVNARDVTEQRRLDRQRREEAKLDAVGRLAGGIAHDFNNLLTVITGYTEVLAGGLVPGSAEADAAGRIAAAADRAAALTRQLLAFGRRHPTHPVPLDVAGVLRGLEGPLGRLAGPAVRVAVRPASGLPVVRADQTQFERVVLNLAANAAEAMPGGGDLVVTARAADRGVSGDDVPPGPYVVVAVADTGAGIPEAARHHLFEPFFTTKDVGGGPGLGLATVHGIVAQAGGHVRYETAAGRGTTFRVYWPAAGAAAPARTPLPDRPVVRRATVLLAEDEPGIRDLAARVLGAAGFAVVAAESGPDALTRLADLPAVDVLVTDVVMPGLGGRELADRVRAAVPGVRVVFMSGYDPDEVLPTDLGPGEVFLAKPFTPDQLVRAVRGRPGV